MSDTPKLPDECKKLLDNGWLVQLFRNDLGSYSAVALSKSAAGLVQAALDEAICEIDDDDIEAVKRGRVITDDFEPSQALYRLTEKVFGRIA
jgi:hypothetical protein